MWRDPMPWCHREQLQSGDLMEWTKVLSSRGPSKEIVQSLDQAELFEIEGRVEVDCAFLTKHSAALQFANLYSTIPCKCFFYFSLQLLWLLHSCGESQVALRVSNPMS